MTTWLSRALLSLLLMMAALLITAPGRASAAACTAPSTDYGTVTMSVTIDVSANYQIWTRMAAANSQDNTYLLEIGGGTTDCYNVGGSSVPVYSSGASQHFNSDGSNWISVTKGGAQVNRWLSAGTHSIKLIGNADGVLVDRLLFVQDGACAPTGTGDNCANPTDSTAPIVELHSPIDGATVTGIYPVTASATDNVGVTKVEFYLDGILERTDTTVGTNGLYKYDMDSSSLADGLHNVFAKAYDGDGNSTTSSVVTFRVGPAPTYGPTDINQDGVVDIQDLSALINAYGQTGSNLGRADINGDSKVDFLDFSQLAKDYNK